MGASSLVDPLRELRGRKIRAILVGGVAAVLHGAPVQTYDIDLVHARDPENVDRLMDFLTVAEAIFRIQPSRQLRPNSSHVAGGGHLNLLTKWGPLDLLGTIGRDLGYEDLLPFSSEMDIGQQLTIPVLDLEMIITLKEELRGEKDQAVLAVLRQTLHQVKERKRT